MDNDSAPQYIYETNLNEAGVDAAIISALFGFVLIFALLSYAVTAFLLGKVFQKAGVPQWAAWVPIYNYWKLLQIGGQPPFWAILAIIPFVNIISLVYVYIAMYHIGRNLQKEGWFVLIAIFFPIIWLIWLAFDDSRWKNVGHETTKKSVPAKSKPKKPSKKSA